MSLVTEEQLRPFGQQNLFDHENSPVEDIIDAIDFLTVKSRGVETSYLEKLARSELFSLLNRFNQLRTNQGLTWGKKDYAPEDLQGLDANGLKDIFCSFAYESNPLRVMKKQDKTNDKRKVPMEENEYWSIIDAAQNISGLGLHKRDHEGYQRNQNHMRFQMHSPYSFRLIKTLMDEYEIIQKGSKMKWDISENEVGFRKKVMSTTDLNTVYYIWAVYRSGQASDMSPRLLCSCPDKYFNIKDGSNCIHLDRAIDAKKKSRDYKRK